MLSLVSVGRYKKYHSGQVRLAMSCYGPFVEEYLAHFGRGQLLVTSLEEYKADPEKTLRKVSLVSRSIPPRWGSVRFRLALRTYDATPWGVHVASLTWSRKMPTRE